MVRRTLTRGTYGPVIRGYLPDGVRPPNPAGHPPTARRPGAPRKGQPEHAVRDRAGRERRSSRRLERDRGGRIGPAGALATDRPGGAANRRSGRPPARNIAMIINMPGINDHVQLEANREAMIVKLRSRLNVLENRCEMPSSRVHAAIDKQCHPRDGRGCGGADRLGDLLRAARRADVMPRQASTPSHVTGPSAPSPRRGTLARAHADRAACQLAARSAAPPQGQVAGQ